MKAKTLVKPIVFVLALLPACYIGYAIYLALSGTGNLLGPDPAQALALFTGQWAIRLLILTIALTPIRYLLNWPYAWQLRRMLGLFALFYATLHFLVFMIFILQLNWGDLGREIAERPYITVGFTAFVLMIPLGLTSFNLAQRKLGRNWKRLHRLVYLISILAIIHMVWIVRSSIADALLYGSLTALFLGYRLLRKYYPPARKFTLRPA